MNKVTLCIDNNTCGPDVNLAVGGGVLVGETLPEADASESSSSPLLLLQ